LSDKVDIFLLWRSIASAAKSWLYLSVLKYLLVVQVIIIVFVHYLLLDPFKNEGRKIDMLKMLESLVWRALSIIQLLLLLLKEYF